MPILGTPVDLPQADDGANDPPASGFSRIFAGTDGRMYFRGPSGTVKELSEDLSGVMVALAQVRLACALLGVDPAMIPPAEALAEM